MMARCKNVSKKGAARQKGIKTTTVARTPVPSGTGKAPRKTMGKAPRKQANPKPRRKKPGVRALMEIRKWQKDYSQVLLKAPFKRLVQQIANNHQPGFRFTQMAYVALQEVAEVHVVRIFEACNIAAISAGRVTVMPKDFHTVRRIWEIGGMYGEISAKD